MDDDSRADRMERQELLREQMRREQEEREVDVAFPAVVESHDRTKVAGLLFIQHFINMLHDHSDGSDPWAEGIRDFPEISDEERRAAERVVMHELELLKKLLQANW